MITKRKENRKHIYTFNLQSSKNDIISKMSKIEMDIISLDKKDFNAVLNIYKRINYLKESVRHLKFFSKENDFILLHIEAHIEKYEYYLRNKYRI
ncbi:hypothetical protein [Anaerofustis butyriciformans]|uniref:hypothetical protein n=1 Tax=Anaerofustis butyriciformans TaxID=3108533 RepID=UPI002E33642F|nr:hypothetical protein [Anaerofustis sp. HA2171]